MRAVLRELIVEAGGLVTDWIIKSAVFAIVDAGTWLRNRHLLPDLWFRMQTTRLIMWLANRIARQIRDRRVAERRAG